MKRSFVVFLTFCLAAGALSAFAQVAPSATGRNLRVNAGGELSIFQPGYNPFTFSATAAPQKLVGIGAYVDADFTRWVQIEAEGRWLHWNQIQELGIGIESQNTYMIGPRVPIVEYKGLVPYGKFLFGWGSGNFLTGRATAWAYGGGLDYRLKKKLTLRAFDFEYQQWQVTPTLHPYGYSFGLAYRVF